MKFFLKVAIAVVISIIPTQSNAGGLMARIKQAFSSTKKPDSTNMKRTSLRRERQHKATSEISTDNPFITRSQKNPAFGVIPEGDSGKKVAVGNAGVLDYYRSKRTLKKPGSIAADTATPADGTSKSIKDKSTKTTDVEFTLQEKQGSLTTKKAPAVDSHSKDGESELRPAREPKPKEIAEFELRPASVWQP